MLRNAWLAVLMVLSLLHPHTSNADIKELEQPQEWQYLEDYEGVKLFRATMEKDGVLPFKAIAELDVPYESLVMALVDAESKPQWAPKLKATRVHKKVDTNTFEYSEYYSTPWPFDDREFLLLGTVTYQQDQVVFSAVNSTNNELALEDHVRANIEVLTFSIKPISPSRSQVEFTFSGDMGGWIPDFVKTIIQKKWPVRFIQALQNYAQNHNTLETARYQALNKTKITPVQN